MKLINCLVMELGGSGASLNVVYPCNWDLSPVFKWDWAILKRNLASQNVCTVKLCNDKFNFI